MTTDLTCALRATATLDHRTGDTLVGGPASRYRRVVRCDGRSGAGRDARAHGVARPVLSDPVGFRGGTRRRAPRRTDCPTDRRPNYAARRLAALLLVTCGIVGTGWSVGQIATGFAGRPASAAAPGSVDVFDASGGEAVDGSMVVSDVHVARSGDTLWSIADAHRGGVERDRYVDALEVLNGGTAVEVGQAVRLPRAMS